MIYRHPALVDSFSNGLLPRKAGEGHGNLRPCDRCVGRRVQVGAQGVQTLKSAELDRCKIRMIDWQIVEPDQRDAGAGKVLLNG